MIICCNNYEKILIIFKNKVKNFFNTKKVKSEPIIIDILLIEINFYDIIHINKMLCTKK